MEINIEVICYQVESEEFSPWGHVAGNIWIELDDGETTIKHNIEIPVQSSGCSQWRRAKHRQWFQQGMDWALDHVG